MFNYENTYFPTDGVPGDHIIAKVHPTADKKHVSPSVLENQLYLLINSGNPSVPLVLRDIKRILNINDKNINFITQIQCLLEAKVLIRYRQYYL